jgi:uncharacterized Zn finger protein (UPF0148 family)
MSDFDKEAEREKLREKYERDREKRKETERMSQLLLQGATMTNRHCDTCGDPLFRYQGNEFCATCEGRAQEAQAAADDGQDRDQSRTGADESVTTAEAGAETGGERDETDAERPTALDADAAGHPSPGVDAGANVDADADADANADERGGSTRADEGAATPPGRPAGAARPSDDDRPAASAPSRTTETRASQRTVGADADLGDARASLVRTLTHHARRAETVDDPRRATDHLTAVREAAEALAALDGRR